MSVDSHLTYVKNDLQSGNGENDTRCMSWGNGKKVKGGHEGIVEVKQRERVAALVRVAPSYQNMRNDNYSTGYIKDGVTSGNKGSVYQRYVVC